MMISLSRMPFVESLNSEKVERHILSTYEYYHCGEIFFVISNSSEALLFN